MKEAYNQKIEYGDFQTPLELANQICKKLVDLGIKPDSIIEPTCGIGNFIETASQSFQDVNKIVGIEINKNYLEQFNSKDKAVSSTLINVIQSDFFQFDWSSLIDSISGKILVLGNFPWVTNSRQGCIEGLNLPNKTNFQKHQGLEAITGKSNFDISEWMLIQVAHWLQNRDAHLAMLCKTSVARKLLNYLYSNQLNLCDCATYSIDAKKYFGASVEACLLVCQFGSGANNYHCNVFPSLDSPLSHRIGYCNDILVKDVDSFKKLDYLYTSNPTIQWRSGIKHDCSNVMELRRHDYKYINGFGEIVDIEDTYVYPLIKGSDIAQNRLNTEKYTIVTQRIVGEATEQIKDIAPKTWKYLESHASYLDNRKSKIYQKNPRFSIFGVGAYTFASWKIAICGLYKKLEFRLVGKIGNKPVVFDDTVYFLSFDEEKVACETLKVLKSQEAISFYSSQIFWDDKRPIKSNILNSLKMFK
jgi:hypothetical protein